MVVEGDARGHDGEDGRASVGDGGFDQRYNLLAVTAEGPRDERAAESERNGAWVDRLARVDSSLLLNGADVGRGGELALGEAVRSVVFDDVSAVDVAADHVQ